MNILKEIQKIVKKDKQRFCFRFDEEGGVYLLPIEQRDLFEYIKEEHMHLGIRTTKELQKRFGEYRVVGQHHFESISFIDPKLLYGGNIYKRTDGY